MHASTPVLILAGKNTIAVEGARILRQMADIVGISTPIGIIPNKNDKGEDSWQPSLRKFASTTPGFQLTTLTAAQSIKSLYLFSLEFDAIIDTAAFKSANLFNIHFSLLPAYKGMYTSALPILHGQTRTGVTLHRIDRGIDTGPIIAQQEFAIGPNDTARDLYFNYMRHGVELFRTHVASLLQNTFTETPQPALGASYFSKVAINYANLKIDFRKTAFEVHNQIRAFTFKEYQLVELEGAKITRSTISTTPSTAKPGTLVHHQDNTLRLSTIDYDLILEIQGD